MFLKFLRKRKNMKRIMWALAILIIPAFVIWGAGSSGKNKTNKPDYAGRFFNKKITYERYINMWNVVRDYAVKTFGNDISEDYIDKLAWDRILLLEEAHREHIQVKDSEVVEKIISFPAFQRNGSFDKKVYKSMLGDAARGFEEKLRDDILIYKLRERVMAGVSINDEEVKKYYKMKTEKIRSSYISIPFSDFEKDVQYEEDGLIKFYKANKEDFKKPEQVNVKYIEIPLSSEELAYKVLDEVKSKKNLEESAGSFTLGVKETGLFSSKEEVPNIGWSYDFTKASFELAPKEIYNVLIKTDKAFYIIQLKEKKGPYIPGFKEVENSVRASYIKNASIDLAEKKTKKLLSDIDNEIKNGKTFEDAVKIYSLEVKQTDLIARDGYISELGPAEEFVEASLSLKIGQIGGPVKMLQKWVLIRPDQFQDIDEAKFSEEKDKFKETLLSAKKEEVLNKWFEALKKEGEFISFTARIE